MFLGPGKSVIGEICRLRKSHNLWGPGGRSGPNCVASSIFVVKGAQVEIHSDRLVTSKIDTNLVDFRKIKYKRTPNKAKPKPFIRELHPIINICTGGPY